MTNENQIETVEMSNYVDNNVASTNVATGKELADVNFCDVRGVEGIKEATYTIAGKEIKVCAASGLKNAQAVMEKVKAGTADYQFIEIMACPNGCVGGGGTPIVDALTRTLMDEDYRALRAKGLYNDDANLPIRKSHENPFIKAAYENFLGEPLGHKAHELLHTHYTPRKKYNTECDK